MTDLIELHARRRKVTAMVSLLHAKGADADTLPHLDSTGWKVLAQLVGSKPPSERTKQMVIREMERASE